MYYSIYATDKANTLEKRMASRPAHVERLKALVDEGRLLVAGPSPAVDNEDPGQAGFIGSVIIARFDSLEAAQNWAQADPYVVAGIYETVEVRPFRKALP